MEKTTYLTENILAFIYSRFKEQAGISDRFFTNYNQIGQYLIKSDFDFLSKTILRNELAEYKKNDNIDYLQRLVAFANENIEIFKKYLEDKTKIEQTYRYRITTTGKFESWLQTDRMTIIQPELAFHVEGVKKIVKPKIEKDFDVIEEGQFFERYVNTDFAFYCSSEAEITENCQMALVYMIHLL
jgi:hypothetical protein